MEGIDECFSCDRLTKRFDETEWRTAVERDAGVCICWRRCVCGAPTRNESGICLHCPQTCSYQYSDSTGQVHACSRQAKPSSWPHSCGIRTHTQQAEWIRHCCSEHTIGDPLWLDFATSVAEERRPAEGYFNFCRTSRAQMTVAEHNAFCRRESEAETAHKRATYEARGAAGRAPSN